jgi:hypothetical protein
LSCFNQFSIASIKLHSHSVSITIVLMGGE